MVHPLWRIGYTGSLKKIKRMLGVTRKEDTTRITGFDAVRVWHECPHHLTDALSTKVPGQKTQSSQRTDKGIYNLIK